MKATKAKRGWTWITASCLSLSCVLLVGCGDCRSDVQLMAIPPYTSAESSWEQIGRAWPWVAIVVLNPKSGPVKTTDPEYTQYMALLKRMEKASFGRPAVLGYIYTDLGDADLKDLQTQIELYYKEYPVSGIFLDRVPARPKYSKTKNTEADLVKYYDQIRAMTTALAGDFGKGHQVVCNTGQATFEAYLWDVTKPTENKKGRKGARGPCDILVDFEGHYRKPGTYDAGYLDNYVLDSESPWRKNYPRYKFWHLVHHVGSKDMKKAIKLSKDRAFWVYVTDDGEDGNPWDDVPIEGAKDDYWCGELEAITGVDVRSWGSGIGLCQP